MDIKELFHLMVKRGASDLFLTAGKPPTLRLPGALERLEGPAVTGEAITSFIAESLPSGIVARLEKERDLDIGLSLSDTERYRLHLGYEKGRVSMTVRHVPSGALDMAELHLPEAVRDLAECPRGLVLVTGATGSGKSTTMAAMLNHINQTVSRHVVTIEDPIEFIHTDKLSCVSQREIGTDTLNFKTALRHVVRQDPDVIIIGEIRDPETVKTAISAALTGHLVISTMHTSDVAQTLERIIHFFPAQSRDQVAMDLSLALRGIISQRLLPKMDGKGMVPAGEILKVTPLAQKLIASRQLDRIESEVLKAGENDGMVTFTQSLVTLCEAGLVAPETALAAASNREEFLLAVDGMRTGIDTLRGLRFRQEEKTDLGMKGLLRAAVRHGASDVLITAGSPPMLRLDGQLCQYELPALSSGDTEKLLFSILSPQQRGQFETEKEIDFALSVGGLFDKGTEAEDCYRFRVNGFYQRGTVAISIRLVAQTIPNPRDIGIPPVVLDLVKRQQGIILVTGPTGHGKSTTLACLIAEINASRSCHIITVEDPIEFVHANQKAIIEQREVYADTKSFSQALKYVLRQDPDVILVGEMRDQETIAAALTAAETGHLVLATLHTNDAAQTIDRIVDAFPSGQQNQIRIQLAASLVAVVAQRLLPKTGEKMGRVAAFEVMIANTAIRALIREKRSHQIASMMETGAREGMVTMDNALAKLYRNNLITRETFKTVATNPNLI
ncbi:MAG: PilT/PilU family type 4a pilus ATPase [Lentisphaeria bacterium]|nr:PilT/PilU family type 4a pilus ATPase [Lentisphaeria bacterium]